MKAIEILKEIQNNSEHEFSDDPYMITDGFWADALLEIIEQAERGVPLHQMEIKAVEPADEDEKYTSRR